MGLIHYSVDPPERPAYISNVSMSLAMYLQQKGGGVSGVMDIRWNRGHGYLIFSGCQIFDFFKLNF